MVTNGAKLRLLRDSARLSRPSYLEFDIRAMMEGNAYGDFAALYRLLHATRLPQNGVAPHECLLESYYNQGIEEGGRVREKLRDGVKTALEILGTALIQHPGSETLRETLRTRLDQDQYYRQLLNFVYRLLFLMVTEERRLLFSSAEMARQRIYDKYYSVAHLRNRAEQLFAGDTHSDLWMGLAQTFRVFRHEETAQTLGLSALNGELFGSAACKDIEEASCTNEQFLQAMRALSTFYDDGVRRRVNYAHLDVEEFGSVYESLLDYRPVANLGTLPGARPKFELAAGTERKQTGSYYTPPELVHELVESALMPVMEERLAAAKTPAEKERALQSLKVCDPASGSGHFLLAAARRIARELARVRTGEDEPNPDAYRAALRDVVRYCIYAVDKNPLAVDLCKVALWIESHASGLPLGFLDHHVKCGDSLVGVMDLSVLEEGIPNDAYKPVTGDDKNAATGYRKRNQQERKGMRPLEPGNLQVSIGGIAEEHAIFTSMEEKNTDEVHAKFDLFRQLRGEGTQWWDLKTASDLWTSAFFLPLIPETTALPQVPTTDTVRKWLDSRAVVGTLTGKAASTAAQVNFFHWPLEFPEVFDNGGFDVVLGNPPWERIKLQEKEFFETRSSDIAQAPNKAARDRLIQALPQLNPELAKEFQDAVHDADSFSRFVRACNRFPLTGRGDINTYSIFAETARTICSPRGQVGMIVPSGIATDDTTKVFFSNLVDNRSLASLYDFENRERVFPGIDSRIKFCLLTMTGAERPSTEAEFAFFLYRPEQLQQTERRFTLAPPDFALFNPNTRTCPVFRTRRDSDIAGKMYRRAGVFWKEARGSEPEANPWGISFQRMFDMSNDSNLFRTLEELIAEGWQLEGNIFVKGEERYLPLYEAKLFHQYDHRFSTFDGVSDEALRGGNARDLAKQEKCNPETVILPRYWVPDQEVKQRLANKQVQELSTPPAPPPAKCSRNSPSWPTARSPQDRTSDRRTNRDLLHDSSCGHKRFWNHYYGWFLAFRDIAAPTNERTAISMAIPGVAVSNKAPLLNFQPTEWLQVFRGITNATNERTMIVDNVVEGGVGNSAPVITYDYAKTVASALVLANLNSLPLDWATRLSVGGVNMNFFIVKQLPVLPPDTYLEEARLGQSWAELIVPRVLELTYTAWDLQPFAQDLGYEGDPFPWDEERRHRLKSELDAIFAHMYQLDREDLEWILDAPAPSASFPGLKRNELQQFGEYRTQRYVLQAYDQLARGELPNLDD